MNRKIHVRFCSRAAEAIPSLRRHLERSGKLCGRAVADNLKEAGKHFADKDDLRHLLIARAKFYAALLNWSFACTPNEAKNTQHEIR